MKNLLVRTKFYWSWARGPVLIVKTAKADPKRIRFGRVSL